jgi:hypothetical protein
LEVPLISSARRWELVEQLQACKPPDDADLDPEAAATQSFWEGPELFVVIDNFELLPYNSVDFPFNPAKVGGETVASLAPQGEQLGLHVLYSAQLDQNYPTGSLMNPLWRPVRQNFSPTLILDGDPTLTRRSPSSPAGSPSTTSSGPACSRSPTADRCPPP